MSSVSLLRLQQHMQPSPLVRHSWESGFNITRDTVMTRVTVMTRDTVMTRNTVMGPDWCHVTTVSHQQGMISTQLGYLEDQGSSLVGQVDQFAGLTATLALHASYRQCYIIVTSTYYPGQNPGTKESGSGLPPLPCHEERLTRRFGFCKVRVNILISHFAFAKYLFSRRTKTKFQQRDPPKGGLYHVE